MKKFLYSLIPVLLFVLTVPLYSQSEDSVELTAQSILARVDRIMQYPAGEMRGRLKHIYPDGKSFSVNFTGSIARDNFLFLFSNRDRGNQLKVLYAMGGEDIWVYNIHSIKLFHKMGIDRYDSLLSTNFSFVDLSNADLQSNYRARITGGTLIKGVECYRLRLEPIFKGSEYGELTIYVSKDRFLPMRIDYHDRDKVVFKFQSLSKTMEKGNRVVPLRYDMLNIKNGTITILSFFKFDRDVKFQDSIFRPETLGE